MDDDEQNRIKEFIKNKVKAKTAANVEGGRKLASQM